ncbi:MAG: hypothetical protein U0031_14535 [Thermomicrobiales bacterium]
MRATQFVRRGLVAFAAVATVSAGLAGAAGAQAVIDGDDAIVWNPVPGYDYEVVHTPDGDRTAVLGVSNGAGTAPVVVRFTPDFDGAAVMYLVQPDVIAQRP